MCGSSGAGVQGEGEFPAGNCIRDPWLSFWPIFVCLHHVLLIHMGPMETLLSGPEWPARMRGHSEGQGILEVFVLHAPV